MILTKKEILHELESKKLKITPLNKSNIGPVSIDLTLSNDFWLFPKPHSITLSETTSAESLAVHKKLNSITLQPGDFVLGRTLERIQMPENLFGILSGRSRFARMGLVIDITSFFVQPGVNNHQVLEIKNLSCHAITLKPGLRIAQLAFLRTEGNARYSGKFKNQ
jgi:dCTP deaminase